MQKVLTVVHNILVDECLLAELDILNNYYGIKTAFSCCGHAGHYIAYIATERCDARRMLDLDYSILLDVGNATHISFRPKTRCKCRTIRVKSHIGNGIAY